MVVQFEIAEDSPFVGLRIFILNTYFDIVFIILKRELQNQQSIAFVKIIPGSFHCVHDRAFYSRNQHLVISCIEIGRMVTGTMETSHTKTVCTSAKDNFLIEFEVLLIELCFSIVHSSPTITTIRRTLLRPVISVLTYRRVVNDCIRQVDTITSSNINIGQVINQSQTYSCHCILNIFNRSSSVIQCICLCRVDIRRNSKHSLFHRRVTLVKDNKLFILHLISCYGILKGFRGISKLLFCCSTRHCALCICNRSLQLRCGINSIGNQILGFSYIIFQICAIALSKSIVAIVIQACLVNDGPVCSTIGLTLHTDCKFSVSHLHQSCGIARIIVNII